MLNSIHARAEGNSSSVCVRVRELTHALLVEGAVVLVGNVTDVEHARADYESDGLVARVVALAEPFASAIEVRE